MKYGYPANPSKNIISEIKLAKRLGFDFPELYLEEPLKLTTIINNKKKIKKLLSEFSAPAIVHTAFWIDFTTTENRIRKYWINESKKFIRCAAILNINMVNFHTFMIFAINKKEKIRMINNFVSSINELSSYAKKFGIKIIIENSGEGAIKRYDEISYILKHSPDVGFHIDTGHAFFNGGMPVIKKYFNTFSKRIEHVHMSDNHGFEDEHLPIGKGTIDYKKVVAMLKKIKYNKTITFEIFRGKPIDAAKSREKIKKMIK